MYEVLKDAAGRKKMIRNSKTTAALLFSLLFAVVAFLTVFTSPVMAADDGTAEHKDKQTILKEMAEDPESFEESGLTGMHKDPTVFQKNFDLSPELKEETITACEDFVSKHLTDGMSDLEKYYTLAIELNKHVSYDWDFWSGGYNMEYYRHQWDAYGVLIDRKAVCAGIAVTYANLCHAAGLPCKFVRIKSDTLDHTINYIPDINGKSYYIDVTENIFFMSDETNVWGTIDLAFSEIRDEDAPSDGSFDVSEGRYYNASHIKDFYDTPFADWYREYALHENTDKKFRSEYHELGSGTSGTHYASYNDGKHPKQIVYKNFDKINPNGLDYAAEPGLWFLDDFYADPEDGSTADITSKILNREFDEQLLNISVKDSYDCATKEALEAAVKGDISVRYFPSASADGSKVITKAACLICGTDYTVTCDSFDADAGEAVLTIKGTGNGDGYTGEYQFSVRLYSAAVTKAPARIENLSYNGSLQALVEAGEAENGTMVYAVSRKSNSEPKDEDYTADIPAATDVGKYYVWYKAIGTAGHSDTQPQKTEMPVTIAPGKAVILADDITLKAGETVRLTPAIDIDKPVKYSFTVYDEDIAMVSGDGTVTGIAEGTAELEILAELTDSDPNYQEVVSKTISVTVIPDAAKTSIKDAEVVLSQTSFTYNAKIQKPEIKTIKGLTLNAGTDYTVLWSDESSLDAGTYSVKIIGTGNYSGLTRATYKINKAANPMTLKGRTANIRHSKVRKKSQTIGRAKVITVNNAQGGLTYKYVTATKGNKSFRKEFTVNNKTGKVTVSKGLKRGTYKVKVRVRAAGNNNFKASAWKTVTFKVRIR